MKASRDAFERAVAPVLADLERQHPGVLRLAVEPEDSDLAGLVWEEGGSGTGLYSTDSWEDDAQAVVEMADQVQDAAIEAVWGVTGSSTWPECPGHPDGVPLTPSRQGGVASWVCPIDDRVVAEIGHLDARASRA